MHFFVTNSTSVAIYTDYIQFQNFEFCTLCKTVQDWLFVYLHDSKYSQDCVWLPVAFDDGFGQFGLPQLLGSLPHLMIPMTTVKEISIVKEPYIYIYIYNI